jgi:hypothetical protein
MPLFGGRGGGGNWGVGYCGIGPYW